MKKKSTHAPTIVPTNRSERATRFHAKLGSELLVRSGL